MDSSINLRNSSQFLMNSAANFLNSSANFMNSSSGSENNSSELDDAGTMSLHGKFGTIYSVVGTLIVIVNVIGIALFHSSKTIFKNLQVYITSLMVCDLLIGVSLLVGPFVFWIFNSHIVVDQSTLFIRTMLLVSLLHTAGLSVDRLISVKLPNFYTFRVTSSVCMVVCFCIWILLAVYHILITVLTKNVPMSGKFDMNTYGLFLIFYLSCLFVYLISSKSIISCAREHLKRTKTNAPSQEQKTANTFRLSIVIITASGFLYILYLPAQIFGALTFLDPFGEMRVTRFFMTIAYPLLTLESLLNPLMYLLRFQETRHLIKRVFCPSMFVSVVSSNTSNTGV